MTGHIEVYIGKEVQYGDTANEVCNMGECTSSWNKGIQLIYVDSFGKRYNKKRGTKESSSAKYGTPSQWVEFDYNEISPQSASDWVLTHKDKKNYKYCYFEKFYKFM